MKTFITDGQETKPALAEIITNRVPEQLSSQLPPKRQAWNSEDSRMNIFGAVALVMTFRLKNTKQTSKSE